MDLIPNEIFFRIHHFLPLIESIKLSQISHGWKICTEAYFQFQKIKINKITVLKDMIDWGYRSRIPYTYLARHIFYYILFTNNRAAYDYYVCQKIFQPFIKIHHDLILYQDPDHPVKYLENIGQVKIYDILTEALFLGEEELAKKIICQDMERDNELDNHLFLDYKFLNMDEYHKIMNHPHINLSQMEHLSDDFIIWFLQKYPNLRRESGIEESSKKRLNFVG